MEYTVSFLTTDGENSNGDVFKVDKEEYEKLLGLAKKGLKKSEKKPKKVKPAFNFLDAFEATDEELHLEDGSINIEYVEDIARENSDWDDEKGEKENKLPWRIGFNDNKHVFEFEVHQGDCIEATWSHRIWGVEIVNLREVTEK